MGTNKEISNFVAEHSMSWATVEPPTPKSPPFENPQSPIVVSLVPARGNAGKNGQWVMQVVFKAEITEQLPWLVIDRKVGVIAGTEEHDGLIRVMPAGAYPLAGIIGGKGGTSPRNPCLILPPRIDAAVAARRSGLEADCFAINERFLQISLPEWARIAVDRIKPLVTPPEPPPPVGKKPLVMPGRLSAGMKPTPSEARQAAKPEEAPAPRSAVNYAAGDLANILTADLLPPPAGNGKIYANSALIGEWCRRQRLTFTGDMDPVNRLRTQFKQPLLVLDETAI